MKVVAFYRLKEGVDREEYRKWAREQDMKTTIKVPGVNSYIITEIKEVERWDNKTDKKEDRYDFMEIADIDNVEVWKKLGEVDIMKKLIREWMDYNVKDSAKIFYADEL